ncbi:MAG: YbgA family protein [Syntrophales bacterium]
MNDRIAIGVSSCLLGEKVRYDGGHKHDEYVAETLGAYFRYVSVCPEVGCGMPTPREAIRLEGDPESPRLLTRISHLDVTEQMLAYCVVRLKELKDADLCGYILKKDSPSCGPWRVKVYRGGGMMKSGSGIFAAAIIKQFPLLPIEEEGRLNDAKIRGNFIERIFSCKRWQDFLSQKPKLGELVEFHTRHKLLLMAHNPQIYREMGKLVAQGSSLNIQDLIANYENMFMKGLASFATVNKHTDVLMHIMGYFKKVLSPPEKAEMLELISQYKNTTAPLVVPLTLLRHYIAKYEQAYLKKQVYFNPHPGELMLRNHV